MTDSECQRLVCSRVGAGFFPAPSCQKLGISNGALAGERPLHGLRHPPEGDTTGWYIWSGEELSEDPELFKPIHVSHLTEIDPELVQFLGLPPGWRFLFDNGYEDIWFDEELLKI